MSHVTKQLGTANIHKLFFKYSIPSIIAMIFFSIYIVIDGIFVGQVVGAEGLAAINIAMPFFSIAMAISIMVSSGATTIVAIELGKGKTEEARKTFSLSFYTLMIISTSVSLFTIIFLEPISRILGASDRLLPMVSTYLVILCIFTPVFTGGSLLSNGIRTMGHPAYAMICSITGSVLNIILDYVFIVKWGWGVTGAALASGIAFFISFIIGFIPYLFKKTILRFTTCKVDFKKIGRIFYNGSSEALTEVSVAFTTYVFNIVLLQRIGEMGVSAFSIISYVTSLFIAVLLGIATGISPITSYNYGAQNAKRIIILNRFTMKIVIGFGMLCSLSMFFFGEDLIKLFVNNDESLISFTVNAAKFYSLAFLINGINILGAGYFTALEDAKTSAIISVLRGMIFIVIGLLILPPIIGENGIWLSVLFSELLTLIFTLRLFHTSYKRLERTK